MEFKVHIIAEYPWLLPVFMLIAILYSAAGFGGGSSYIAVLSLTELSPVNIRSIAYLCNVTVSGSGAVRFSRRGLLPFRLAIPFLVASVPLTMLGAAYRPDADTYKLIMACALLPAGILLLASKQPRAFEQMTFCKGAMDVALTRWLTAGVIGFVSGLVGIGGGIFLAPILHFTQWRSPGEIAAVSASFIFVNALAGFAVLLFAGAELNRLADALVLAPAVFIGMLIGTTFALSERGRRWIRFTTGVIVIIAGAGILIRRLAEII